MKTFLKQSLFLAVSLCFFSCKKDDTIVATDTSAGFTAKINGNLVAFNVLSSALSRSTHFNVRQLDISGISTDGKLRLALTVREEAALGNDIPAGDRPVALYRDDNPATPEDESEFNSNAFFTLSIAEGNDFHTDVDAENGHISIVKIAVSGTTGIVTGTFNGILESKTGSTDYTIEDGIFTELKYSVLN